MSSSQSDWDKKYRLTAAARPAEPASIVGELLPLLPRGPALDVACGTGRHSLLLGARGQHVTAVDWSGAGLEVLEARARAEGIPIRRISSAEQSSIVIMAELTLCKRTSSSSSFPKTPSN